MTILHLINVQLLSIAKEGWPIVLYMCVAALGSVAFLSLLRHRRNTRDPFCDLAGVQVKLTRQPGESLLKKWHESSDEFGSKFAFMLMIPPVIATAVWLTLMILVVAFKAPAAAHYGDLCFFVALLASTGVYAHRLARHAFDSSNYYLGYFGERYVAELLAPLTSMGYSLFHDVPCPAGNIDHVAVGPAGVFAIETKTRRKKKSRASHKVSFDGRSLVGPWGEDNRPLEQAEQLSMWLADSIKKHTGTRPFVQPIVTLPEWYIETKPGRGDARLARVVATKALAPFISSGRRVLTDEAIKGICSLLDQTCRNVTY